MEMSKGRRERKLERRRLSQEDGEGQNSLNYQQKRNQIKEISYYDRIEEIRFQQYELKELMRNLNEVIAKQSESEDDGNYFSANILFSLDPEVWQEIRNFAEQVQQNFEDIITQQETVFEQLQNQIAFWKHKSISLKNKINNLRTDNQMQNSDWIQREEDFQKSLKIMASAYEKNRTQMFDAINDIELAVHDMKNGREKLNVKHLGNISYLEKEMEEAFSFLSQSGRYLPQKQIYSSRSSKIEGPQPGQGLDKTTPRGLAQQQQKQIPKKPIPPLPLGNNKQDIRIPPLPMHMLHREGSNSAVNSKRGGQLNNQSARERQLSSKRRQQSQRRNQEEQKVERRGGDSSRNQVTSFRSNSQGGSLGGGIVDGYLVNPVFVQAAGFTSKFVKSLESECGTIDLRTERLQQFQDEYEMLMKLEDQDQILFKQWLFMKYELQLKAQRKEEREERRRMRMLRKQQQLDGTTPRQQQNIAANNNENEQTLKESSRENQQQNRGSVRGQRKQKQSKKESSDSSSSSSSQTRKKKKQNSLDLGDDEEEKDDCGIMDVSHLELDSPLPQLTQNVELQTEDFQDVKLTQLLDASRLEDDLNMKTVTRKDIIDFYDQKWEQQKKIHDEARVVLEWSHGTNNNELDKQNNQDQVEEIKQFEDPNQYVVQQEEGRDDMHYLLKKDVKNAINIVDMYGKGEKKSRKTSRELSIKEGVSEQMQQFEKGIDIFSNCSDASSSLSDQVNLNIIGRSSMNSKKGQVAQPKQSPVYISQHIKNTIQTLHQKNNDDNSILEQQLSSKVPQKSSRVKQQEESVRQLSEREKKIQQINNYRYNYQQYNNNESKKSARSIIDQDQSMFKGSSQERNISKSQIQEDKQEEQEESKHYSYRGQQNKTKSRQENSIHSQIIEDNSILGIHDKKISNKVKSARESTPSSLKQKATQNKQQVFCYGVTEEENSKFMDIINPKKQQQYSKQNLQSAPNSQRNRIQNQKNEKDLLEKDENVNNFYSIQVDDFDYEIQTNINKPSQKHSRKSNSKSTINDIQSIPQQSFRDGDTASFKKQNQKKSSKKSKQVSERSDSDQSLKNLNLNINISREEKKQKKLLELKKEEEDIVVQSKMESTEQKILIKSSSEVLLRDSQRLYDLNDFMNDNNIQQRINQYFKQASNEEPSQLFGNESINNQPSRQLFYSQNQESSLKMNNLNQYGGGAQQHNQSQLYNEYSQLFQHQTSGNFAGIQTRDVPTCKKRDARESGSLAFSFTASSNETLYQFLQSNKKTLQMMQNLYNNFCHNLQAGVLFTMNGTKDDMNNEFLGHCQTIPSDPNFINRNGGGKQDATNFQNQNAFSLSRIALSTDESGGKFIQNQNKRINKSTLNIQEQPTTSTKLTLDSGLNIKRMLQHNNFMKGGNQTNQIQSQTNNSFTSNAVRTPNMVQLSKYQRDQVNNNNLINSQASRGSSIKITGNSASIYKGLQDMLSSSPAGSALSGFPHTAQKGNIILNRNTEKQRSQIQDQIKPKSTVLGFGNQIQQRHSLQSNPAILKKENIKRISIQKIRNPQSQEHEVESSFLSNQGLSIDQKSEQQIYNSNSNSSNQRISQMRKAFIIKNDRRDENININL